MSPTSQPLRLAYISIVIAVHEARLAASSSWGLGPSSLPPWSFGSSAVMWCSRISTSCLKSPPSRRAIALMPRTLLQQVEDEAGWDLREEVGRLGRHRLARLGHLSNLLDGDAAHEEGRLVAARLDGVAGVGEVLRVAEPVLMRDVVLGHPERPFEHERLEHGGVEPAVEVGLARQGAVGDRLVPQGEAQRPAVEGIEVAEHDAL